MTFTITLITTVATAACVLCATVARGELKVAEHGIPVRNEERLRVILGNAIREQLPHFAAAALLVA